MNNDEILDEVNIYNEIVGQDKRDEFHITSKRIHRVVMALFYNKQGEVLIAKRSMKKKVNPGIWMAPVAGHVPTGEDLDEGIKREVKEEIGIDSDLSFYGLRFVVNPGVEARFIHIYYAVIDDPKFKMDENEVEYVQFITLEKVFDFINKSTNKEEKAVLELLIEVYNNKVKKS